MRYFPPNGTAGLAISLVSAYKRLPLSACQKHRNPFFFDDHLDSPPLNSNLYFRMIIPPSNRRIFSLLFSLRKLFPIALLYGCASALLRQELLPVLPLPLTLPFLRVRFWLCFGRSFCRFFLCLWSCLFAGALRLCFGQELLPILPLPLELPFLRVRFGFASTIGSAFGCSVSASKSMIFFLLILRLYAGGL